MTSRRPILHIAASRTGHCYYVTSVAEGQTSANLCTEVLALGVLSLRPRSFPISRALIEFLGNLRSLNERKEPTAGCCYSGCLRNSGIPSCTTQHRVDLRLTLQCGHLLSSVTASHLHDATPSIYLPRPTRGLCALAAYPLS